MRGFVDPEVFDGGVRITGKEVRRRNGQTELALDGGPPPRA
jgi:hypothetical protein